LDVRSIGIYGSTDIGLTGALGQKHKNISSGYECSPCLAKICKVLDEKNKQPCLDSITPESILKNLEDLRRHES